MKLHQKESAKDFAGQKEKRVEMAETQMNFNRQLIITIIMLLVILLGIMIGIGIKAYFDQKQAT